jgi:DNA repair protein RecN (Recombination protein N)
MDSSESVGAIDLIQKALQSLEQVADSDPQLAELSISVQEAIENLENVSRTLRRYRESLETDPEVLAEIEARLNQLASIKRKYGPTLVDAIALRDKLVGEVERLENSQITADKLKVDLQVCEDELKEQAKKLSQERKNNAMQLTTAVRKELADLGMEVCQFEIAFEEIEPGSNGIDKIEMLIAPNPGQPLLPVSKIASGGELSRVMLAIKSIFAKADKVSTVVFDEIDTGLSGKVLQAVRDKLARLSRSHQILCITHQPMIASVADNHVQINKAHSINSTSITATILEDDERIKSVASMASGYEDQKEALNFAEALLSEANTLRSSLRQ